MSDDKKPEATKPPTPPGPPPAKNPGQVTLTIDEREVVAQPGTNLIDAAKSVGVDIPYFCYHPRLSVSANCRMCMVESSMAPPGKLVPACQTVVAEGMAIKTKTPRTTAQQKMVMEFLLLNHPVDCPICDQAGECKLQDYYMRHDSKPSRLEGGKVLRSKRKALSELIVLDQERCILCSRCVRFMKEVAKAPQLGIFGRGSHEVVDVAPHFGKLESNYSGNIVDLCPVGALLNRDFRFRARAWFLSTAPSVCSGCSRGCSTWVDFMGQEAYRFRPRENEAVNKSWMCDAGRQTVKRLSDARVMTSRAGRASEGVHASAAEAVQTLAKKLAPLAGQVALAVSPTLTNEDLLAVAALAKDVLKVQALYVTGRAAGAQDFFLMTADKNPNRRGLELIAKAQQLELRPFEALTAALDAGACKALIAFGHDVPEAPERFAARAQRLELFAMTATNQTAVTEQAHALLAAASEVEEEGSFTQLDGLTQRVRRAFPPLGEAQPTWRWAADLATALGQPLGVASAQAVFETLGRRVEPFVAFEWERAAPPNQARPGIGTMATAADGRPPGWREQGIPNLRGLNPSVKGP